MTPFHTSPSPSFLCRYCSSVRTPDSPWFERPHRVQFTELLIRSNFGQDVLSVPRIVHPYLHRVDPALDGCHQIVSGTIGEVVCPEDEQPGHQQRSSTGYSRELRTDHPESVVSDATTDAVKMRPRIVPSERLTVGQDIDEGRGQCSYRDGRYDKNWRGRQSYSKAQSGQTAGGREHTRFGLMRLKERAKAIVVIWALSNLRRLNVSH